MKTISKADYERLLALPIPTPTPPASLDHLGMLTDAAHLFRDAAGAKHAITIANKLDTSAWTSADHATRHFFLANAHDDLRNREKTTPDERWEWTSTHFDE